MKEKDKRKSLIRGKGHKAPGQKMNSQSFANQNKTSAKDTRENIGAVGASVSRMRPNIGTQRVDYKDNVKGHEAQRIYKAKYSSGASDAKKSAGLPQGTAKKK